MQLKQLVTDLVDLGALQSGAFRMHFGPVNLPQLLSECAESARPEAEAKKLALESGLAPGVPSLIQTDEARLRHVLLILLDNAVKFTAQGRVTLAAKLGGKTKLSAPLAGARDCVGTCLEIHISDTGPGLGPEDRVRILQLFSRLESGGRGVGSGLSLALAARLCQALGGSLHVESDGHCGSTFIVRLPLGVFVEAPAGEATDLAPVMPSGA